MFHDYNEANPSGSQNFIHNSVSVSTEKKGFSDTAKDILTIKNMVKFFLISSKHPSCFQISPIALYLFVCFFCHLSLNQDLNKVQPL